MQSHSALTAVDANAAGQITHETLGNGLSTHRRYDPASGHIDTITTGLGGAVQRLDYLFDELGNLTQRADVAQDLREDFLYDELNRLPNWMRKSNTGSSSMSLLARLVPAHQPASQDFSKASDLSQNR